MSLRSPVVYFIPEDTEQAARASFPKGRTGKFNPGNLTEVIQPEQG